MLLAGDVDAYIDPHPPEEIFTDPRVRRLFSDAPEECRRYWNKHGYYPVMHLIAMREELVDEMPGLPREVMRMWDDAREQSYEFYTDPDYTVLPFGRYDFESSLDFFKEDLWSSGVSANRACIERFIGYMVDQQLLKEPVSVDELFHESVLNT